MKVKINGKEYSFEIDGVWGMMYTYEQLVGDKLPYDANSTLCMHILFWCILLRCNEGFDLGLDEFLSALSDVELATKMKEEFYARMEVLNESARIKNSGAGEEDKKKG